MNLTRANLNLLVVFDAVARTRSVTAAADLLSLSQPAVSHALKRLRNLMRDPLFVRGRDGLALTPRAEECVVAVETILAAVERVLVTERFEPATTARTFRFAASDYAMMTMLPTIVGRLRAAAPSANIEIHHVEGDLQDRMERSEVDVAFVGPNHSDGVLRSRELFREHLVGLLCESHPLATKASQGRLSLKDYLAYPHISVTFRTAVQNPIDASLKDLGRTRRVAMLTPNFSASLASLRRTDLIASLPSRLADISAEPGLLVFGLPLAIPDYPYRMIWHRRTEADPAISWLRQQVIEATEAFRLDPSPSRAAQLPP